MNELLKLLLDLPKDEFEELVKKVRKRHRRKKEELPFRGHNEELKILAESHLRHIRIISWFAKAQGVIFENREQITSFISRNSRAAILLIGYSQENIFNVMKYLKKQNFKWTLETVGKYIDTDIAKVKTIGERPRALGEFIN